MMQKTLPLSDLESILFHTRELWLPLRKKRIFLTGGTGFIGKWLTESFLHANNALQLEADISVLSRFPKRFLSDHPWLASRKDFHLIEGDVRSFEYPAGSFSHIIHGGTSISDPEPPMETFDTILSGTKHVLEFSKYCNAEKFLFLSSGAVYGKQPPSVARIPESYDSAPPTNTTQSAYGQAKRAAEWIAFEMGKTQQMDVCVARCFSFVGPYLPLDKHFAIGNFIRDSMSGNPIRLTGNGTPSRSYLYASDLSVWLWTILLRGKNHEIYNVGSDKDITILELAKLVERTAPLRTGLLLPNSSTSSVPPERYIPCIDKIKESLGVSILTPLESAIKKTMDWIAKKP